MPPIKNPTFAAIDLGASNGRVMAGRLLDGVRLDIRETHRFEHSASVREGLLRWDWSLIRSEIRNGLAALPPACSVSCCSWAQDFGLLDADGNLLGDPVSYLDPRTAGMPEKFRDVIAPEELVRRAGVAQTNITTLCQLRAMADQEPDRLARAKRLLHIADLVHYDLCGAAATDWTMASAAQMCNRQSGGWDRDLLAQLGIPAGILPELKPAPAILGYIPADRAPAPGWAGVPVALTAGHDTPTAFHVLPSLETDTLFISCGTWIMLGIRTVGRRLRRSRPDDIRPPINLPPATLLGMPGGGWGIWRGGLGLWLIQQCRRAWQTQGRDWSPAELTAAAASSANQSLIDAHDPRIAEAADVPAAIREACRAAGLQPPESPGDTARIVYRSLAQACRDDMRMLEAAAGRPFRRVRIVGGGSRNALFCQWLADACGLPVDIGPLEAAAAGNLLMQIQAVGQVRDAAHLDEIRRASFKVNTMLPAV